MGAESLIPEKWNFVGRCQGQYHRIIQPQLNFDSVGVIYDGVRSELKVESWQ